jgi:hypothetical protein
MTPLSDTYHKLEVYRTRLLAMRMSIVADLNDIMWYEQEIVLMEADIAVAELISELEWCFSPQVWEVVTDCWQTVSDLKADAHIVKIERKWSWKKFKRLWYVRYINKHQKCYS